ncbi:MAG: T9SS type A sorting domain-containing protein [candidate division WOR-3 bacterium]
MLKNRFSRLVIIAGFILAPAMLCAQAFPIAVGPDTTFSVSAVYGGPNGIVAIMGDTSSQYSITAQLVKPPDGLIGNRISVGRQGFYPVVASDMTNYLLIWEEFNYNLNGQFISTPGNLVGSVFTIATNLSSDFGPGRYSLCFGDTAYLAIFVRTDTFLYGQRISKSGSLIGSQIQISNNKARENAIAFDGNRYLLCQHEATNESSPWWLVGRFITTSGVVEQRITICDSTKYPFIPGVAFDGNNYLITWTQIYDRRLMGRYWTPPGVPVGDPFVVFDSIDSKIPAGGCGFGGNYFLVVGTRINEYFTDGDVYGRFYPQTGVEEKNNLTSENSVLFQNYPKPFSQTTKISYHCPEPARVMTEVYNIAGQEVLTLADKNESAGEHSVIWDAHALSSGVYFFRININGNVLTRRGLLVK